MAPAMMKASPTVPTRDIERRTATRARMAATARFNAARPQRVSSPDAGTRPNALLRLNMRVRSTGPGKTTVVPTCRSAVSAHCFDNWSRPSTTATTNNAITRVFWHLLTSETSYCAACLISKSFVLQTKAYCPKRAPPFHRARARSNIGVFRSPVVPAFAALRPGRARLVFTRQRRQMRQILPAHQQSPSTDYPQRAHAREIPIVRHQRGGVDRQRACRLNGVCQLKAQRSPQSRCAFCNRDIKCNDLP